MAARPEDPLELCQLAMERFNGGDVEAIVDGFDEDVEWWPLRSQTEGPYHGHEGVRRWVAETDELFEYSYATITEASWRGDAIIAEGRIDLKGKQSGAPIQLPITWIFRVKGDKLVWGRAFTDRRAALTELE
jgi:ketosteroid isomerase-like protein